MKSKSTVLSIALAISGLAGIFVINTFASPLKSSMPLSHSNDTDVAASQSEVAHALPLGPDELEAMQEKAEALEREAEGTFTRSAALKSETIVPDTE